MLRRLLLLVLALAALAAGAYFIRNPERATLDDATRAGVPGRFVALGDGVTHYDLAGPDTGQRVILIHGFSTPYYIWDSTSIALAAAGFRVARYDLFGRGYSDRPDVDYGLDLYDRQLLQLLDSLGWKEPVDIVGLSMGGMVVGGFAGRHPDRVRTMTMVDPAAGPPDRLPLQFRLPLIGPFLWQLLVVPGMADGQNADFLVPSKWPDWSDRYRVQMGYQGFGRALRSTQLHRVDLDTLYARVGAVGTRSLLIWGRQDSVVPFKESERVRKAIPQIRFEPIDSAAHLPHMERTDLVNPILIDFLRGKTTAAGLVLPPPTGSLPVGTTRYLVERDGRVVPVSAWYPAAAADGSPAPYLPEAAALEPLAAAGRPVGTVYGFRDALTHATLDAPPRAGDRPWPVIVFSHGYLGMPSDYTALMEDLASHGYAVFSLAHVGESMVATVAGGRVESAFQADGKLSPLVQGVLTEWNREDSIAAASIAAADSTAALEILRGYLGGIPKTTAALERWVSDTWRVVDDLFDRSKERSGSPFAGRLDLSRLGAAGHSMGGLTSAAFCARDPRCKAALNLDGSPQYGDLVDRPSSKPFLMVYGDRASRIGVSDPIYRKGAEYWRALVAGAGHADFGDWLFWPADKRPGGAAGGSPGQIGPAVRQVVREFFDRTLSGQPAPLFSGERPYPGLDLRRIT